jgi:hypothetical protein
MKKIIIIIMLLFFNGCATTNWLEGLKSRRLVKAFNNIGPNTSLVCWTLKTYGLPSRFEFKINDKKVKPTDFLHQFSVGESWAMSFGANRHYGKQEAFTISFFVMEVDAPCSLTFNHLYMTELGNHSRTFRFDKSIYISENSFIYLGEIEIVGTSKDNWEIKVYDRKESLFPYLEERIPELRKDQIITEFLPVQNLKFKTIFTKERTYFY